MPTHTQGIIAILLATFIISMSSNSGEALEIFRHELNSHIGWTTETLIYDHYVTNDEVRPTKTETLDTDGIQIAGGYTFLWPPVSTPSKLPIALRRFYARSSSFSIQGFLQPENRTTIFHQDRQLQYNLSVTKEQRAQNAAIALEYFLSTDTALLVEAKTIAADETFASQQEAIASHHQSTGSIEEMRRYYTLGICRYLTDNWNFTFRYTILDFAYRKREKTWPEDRPILFTTLFLDSDTNGHSIEFHGHYIFQKNFGFQGGYQFLTMDTQSDYLSVFSNNFPELDFFYTTRHPRHRWYTLFSAYINARTTLQLGGSYTVEQVTQTHETERSDTYDWQIITGNIELLYYMTDQFEVQVHYEVAHQIGEGLIAYPTVEDVPRTTFDIEKDTHFAYIGFRASF